MGSRFCVFWLLQYWMFEMGRIASVGLSRSDSWMDGWVTFPETSKLDRNWCKLKSLDWNEVIQWIIVRVCKLFYLGARTVFADFVKTIKISSVCELVTYCVIWVYIHFWTDFFAVNMEGEKSHLHTVGRPVIRKLKYIFLVKCHTSLKEEW